MKKLKAIVVGAGNRGQVYCDYSITKKDELEIIAAVDTEPLRLQECKTKYAIADNMLFSDLDEFLKRNIECDFVINATMDKMHYESSMKLIGAGYNLILEKPITPTYGELEDIWNLATEKNVKVLVCHVLRYTPYYRTIKELIDKGEIGRIFNIEMSEHVWIVHFLDSFVRGKWGNEKNCGSGFLLQKCSHDMDLMCWLNNATKPVKVSSFGSRSHFIPKNAPEGATEFCYQCPHNDTCLYSAQKVHLEQDMIPFQTWRGIDKPWQEITKEEKAEHLKHDNYGRCAYNAGGDIVDRQVVTVEFEDGTIATHNLVGGVTCDNRFIHIIGSDGEIYGHVNSGKFTVSHIDRSGNNYGPVHQEFDVSNLVQANNNGSYSGHGGGDYAIMHDAVRFFAGEGSSVSITKLEDSIYGHVLVYAAEESRKEGRVINIALSKGSFENNK